VHHEVTCRRLSAKTSDRFAGISWEASAAGAVFIDGASVWLECSIDQCISAGDHEIALLRIETLKVEPDVSPLVFMPAGSESSPPDARRLWRHVESAVYRKIREPHPGVLHRRDSLARLHERLDVLPELLHADQEVVETDHDPLRARNGGHLIEHARYRRI
jgi:hypothetical protein